MRVRASGEERSCGGQSNCRAVVATAAVVTTAAVVGSIVNSQPSGCTNSMYGGYNYMYCNGTW